MMEDQLWLLHKGKMPDITQAGWSLLGREGRLISKEVEGFLMLLGFDSLTNYQKHYLEVIVKFNDTRLLELDVLRGTVTLGQVEFEVLLNALLQKLLEVYEDLLRNDFQVPQGTSLKRCGKGHGMSLQGRSVFLQMDQPNPTGIKKTSDILLLTCSELVGLSKHLIREKT